MSESALNNGWVESYLEALLAAGLSTEYSKKPAESEKVDADRQIYSKYYVTQILQLGEEGIQDAWHKATSARHYGEKDARLEYLSWRVWFMKRNRERVRIEEGRRIANELVPDEAIMDEAAISDEEDRTPKAAIAALKEELKPSATKDALDGSHLSTISTQSLKTVTESAAGTPMAETPHTDLVSPRDSSPHGDPFEGRVDGLYVILISLHGLVRGDKMELGKDPDTGGQIKYVVELARAIARHPAVYRVDLLTRLIEDPKVDATYGVEEECILPGRAGEDSENNLGGAYIVRLPCGPRNQYLRKEKLWPHAREFADRGIAHAKRTINRLAENKTPCELYVIHGHYADAGEVAAMMSCTLNVDMVMTGHSLGRNKLEHLLASGTMSKAEIESTYKISRRIEGEERGLESAMMVFTSTEQEIVEQWGLYDGYDRELQPVLRARHKNGRHMPLMKVIPPGLDFSALKVDLPEDPAIKELQQIQPVFNTGASPRASESPRASLGLQKGKSGIPRNASYSTLASEVSDVSRYDHGAGVTTIRDAKEDPPIWAEIARFLRNPRKPVILAMSRPDAKKNITTLVKAFGEDRTLRKLANLVLIMGNRENIDSMASGSQKILNQVLKLIDMHDLYGSVAYPKKHAQSDISDIYRLPFATRGIFTNVALQEPFGLTVIEAAAHGVPTVATKNGGPVDIMTTLHHGLLVDPNSSKDIAQALLKILTNAELWDEMSHNGVKNIMAYSWPSHCKKYLEAIEAEKRFFKRHKRRPHRLSGSWDHRSQLPTAASGGGFSGRQDRGHAAFAMMDRMFSTPNPDVMMGKRLQRSGPSGGSFGGERPTDDMAVTDHKEEHIEGGACQAVGRKHLVAVQYDGPFRTKAVAQALSELLASSAGAKGEVGVGVASMSGFDETFKELQGAGVDMAALDFIICHGGSDIWLARAQEGKAVEWSADEAWEELIEFRWDRASLQRLLTKLVSAPSLISAQSTGTKGLHLVKALGNLPEQQQKGIHPHHVAMELDGEAKQILGGGKQGSGAISTSIVDRLRRRLRSNGYRTHLTLQMVPEAGNTLLSRVHITPLRASRALATRYLAQKFGLEIDAVTMVMMPPFVREKGDIAQLGAFTSDLAELVSGACKVWISVPERADVGVDISKVDAGDAASMERLQVKVGAKLFGERVQFAKGGDSMAAVIKQAQRGSGSSEG